MSPVNLPSAAHFLPSYQLSSAAQQPCSPLLKWHTERGICHESWSSLWIKLTASPKGKPTQQVAVSTEYQNFPQRIWFPWFQQKAQTLLLENSWFTSSQHLDSNLQAVKRFCSYIPVSSYHSASPAKIFLWILVSYSYIHLSLCISNCCFQLGSTDLKGSET